MQTVCDVRWNVTLVFGSSCVIVHISVAEMGRKKVIILLSTNPNSINVQGCAFRDASLHTLLVTSGSDQKLISPTV